jgi:hypothetical protein
VREIVWRAGCGAEVALRMPGDDAIPFVGFGWIVNLRLRVCVEVGEPDVAFGEASLGGAEEPRERMSRQ